MEVVLSNCKNHPSCPHGPCLLFERHTADGSMSKRRFFACSACRYRTECSFFQWADDSMSKESKALWEKNYQEKRPPYSHEDFMKIFQKFKSLPVGKRKYCKTCSHLILDESENHSNHNIFENVSSQHLVQPSLLFEIHENKKVEAQYFFSEATVTFITSLLKDLGFSKFVSIGVPKIHEYIVSNKSDELSSFLMDIDYRYMQFFSSELFCHYNMFNNHFFDGKNSKRIFKNFLFEKPDEKVVILLDPPFGGLVDAISYTLKNINKCWQRKNNTQSNVPIVWVFPYFHEARILKNLPDMQMTDYKVHYVNHKKFVNTKSPVRIFTNIDASSFVLPAECGYRFCCHCERYVSKENKHCSQCNACTTKHGKTYHHCDFCQQCVKSSYIHCQKCNKCGLHSSENSKTCQDCQFNSANSGEKQLIKCFKCSGIGHRKRNCPGVSLKHVKRRKIQKV